MKKKKLTRNLCEKGTHNINNKITKKSCSGEKQVKGEGEKVANKENN